MRDAARALTFRVLAAVVSLVVIRPRGAFIMFDTIDWAGIVRFATCMATSTGHGIGLQVNIVDCLKAVL